MPTNDTVETILDAAEVVFGTHGFEGTSMRLISEKAGITQSLLHYHFSNKEGLYTAVFARRSELSTNYRREKLAELSRGKEKPTLEDVLEIFVAPPPQFFKRAGRSAHYLQMVAEVTLAANERSKKIVSQFHDPSAQDFIAAFRQVVPRLSHERAVWAYLFAVGARQQARAQNDRAARLGGGRREPPPPPLVPFLAAGIRTFVNGSDKA